MHETAGSYETEEAADARALPATPAALSEALAMGDELARLAATLQELELAYGEGYPSISLAPRRKMERSHLYQALEQRQKALRAALVALG